MKITITGDMGCVGLDVAQGLHKSCNEATIVGYDLREHRESGRLNERLERQK